MGKSNLKKRESGGIVHPMARQFDKTIMGILRTAQQGRHTFMGMGGFPIP